MAQRAAVQFGVRRLAWIGLQNEPTNLGCSCNLRSKLHVGANGDWPVEREKKPRPVGGGPKLTAQFDEFEKRRTPDGGIHRGEKLKDVLDQFIHDFGDLGSPRTSAQLTFHIPKPNRRRWASRACSRAGFFNYQLPPRRRPAGFLTAGRDDLFLLRVRRAPAVRFFLGVD